MSVFSLAQTNSNRWESKRPRPRFCTDMPAEPGEPRVLPRPRAVQRLGEDERLAGWPLPPGGPNQVSPPPPGPSSPPPSGLDRGWYVPHVSWVLVWPATRVPCGQTLPGVRANYQRSACVRAGVRARVCERASERASERRRGGQLLHTFNTALKRESKAAWRRTHPPQISPGDRPTDYRTEPSKSKRRKRTAIEHGRRNPSFARETVTGT